LLNDSLSGFQRKQSHPQNPILLFVLILLTALAAALKRVIMLLVIFKGMHSINVSEMMPCQPVAA
jgi:hypothetical protein